MCDGSDAIAPPGGGWYDAAALRQIMDQAPAMISVRDPAGRYQYVNHPWEASLGVRSADALGRTIAELFPSLTTFVQERHANDRRVLETGTVTEAEEAVPGAAGERTFRVRRFPLRDDAGRVVAVASVGSDVTSQRQAQDEAARSRQVTAILESTTDAFFALDSRWRFTYLNPRAESLLQHRPGELLGRDLWDEFPHAVGGPFWRHYHRALAEQAAVEFAEFYPLLGTWFEFHAYPTSEGLAVYFRDITPQKRAETAQCEAAQRQREFVRDVLASVTDGRLRLCISPDDLPGPLPGAEDGGPVRLDRNGGLSALRRAVRRAGVAQGMPEARLWDLVTAASEAGMNAVVHAGGGSGAVQALPTGGVRIWVTDRGGGIPVERLPRATLEKGFTTVGMMGHGFKMMLQTADSLWLLTGPTGTTMVLEQGPDPSPLML